MLQEQTWLKRSAERGTPEGAAEYGLRGEARRSDVHCIAVVYYIGFQVGASEACKGQASARVECVEPPEKILRWRALIHRVRPLVTTTRVTQCSLRSAASARRRLALHSNASTVGSGPCLERWPTCASWAASAADVR